MIVIIIIITTIKNQAPSLFHPLPCVWNYQKSLQYLTDPKVALEYGHNFDEYGDYGHKGHNDHMW